MIRKVQGVIILSFSANFIDFEGKLAIISYVRRINSYIYLSNSRFGASSPPMILPFANLRAGFNLGLQKTEGSNNKITNCFMITKELNILSQSYTITKLSFLI